MDIKKPSISFRSEDLGKARESMGYVYIMRDPRAHNDIKVGFSINPLNRQKQFYRTNRPLPLELKAVWLVGDQRVAEKIVHDFFREHRITKRREWFEIVPLTSYLYHDAMQSDLQVTTDELDQQIEDIEDEFKYWDMPFSRVLDLIELKQSITEENIRFME